MRIVLVVVLAMCAVQLVQAGDHDYDYDYQITFEIDEGNDGWSATSKEIVSHIYRTKKSLREQHFYETVAFYNKITDIDAEINDDDFSRGGITFSKFDFDDTFLNDVGYYTLKTPRAPVVGDYVRYEVEREWVDVAYASLIRIPNYNRVRSYKVIIEHPEEVQVDFIETPARSNIKGTITRPDDETTVITYTNIPYAPSLTDYPHNGYHGFVEIKLMKDGKSLTRDNAVEYAKWYTSQFSQECDVPDSVRAEIFPELKGATSRLDTLRVLHDHVRSEIRYLADERSAGAFIPRRPNTVVKNGYGDCKDRAHLISSMARSMGIDAWMVLIHTETAPLNTKGVHLSDFNHVIVAAVVDGDTLFFDPTARFAQIDDLPRYDANKKVLIMDTLAPRVAYTPKPLEEPTVQYAINGDMAELGNANATVSFTGTMAQFMKYRETSFSASDLEESLVGTLGTYFTKVKFSEPVITVATDTLVVVDAKADLSKLIIKGSSKSYCPKFPLRICDSDVLDRKDDDLPIKASRMQHVKADITITAPGVKIEEVQETITDKGPLKATYKMTAKDGDTYVFSSEFAINQSIYTGQSRQDYLAFVADVYKQRKEFHAIIPAQ